MSDLVEALADELAGLSGVVAVTLGGSRATGQHRPDSDWDIGLYYRGTLDPAELRALGYQGTVATPGEWAYPMNGGAWLAVQGQKVDVLYRDLDDVESWVARSEAGRWELFRVPGYLAGMASYVLAGELALGEVLRGSLPRPRFPERLRQTAPPRWDWEASFALEHAAAHARGGDRSGALGKACQALVATAQSRLAAQGEWALNEKGIVARAGLLEAEETLLGGGDEPLVDRIARVSEVLSQPPVTGR